MAKTFDGRITWLGHSMFCIESRSGRRLVLDPFMTNNPKYPPSFDLSRVDVIAPTHGHFDHFGDDGPELARSTGATVVCVFELALWLGAKGIPNVSGMNKGGTQVVGDFTITMVDAVHSSGASHSENNPPSDPCGYVVRVDDFTIYHAGDTALSCDMALTAELHHPDLALLPIGDFYTMGPHAAAKACELLKAPLAIPMHYGTFPVLSGTAAIFEEEIRRRRLETDVVVLKPGQSWPR